jgi:DNA repair and recombination protein RAD52
MSFNGEQIGQLEAPLSKAHVKRNPRGFDYVEGWHAIAEANRIFGFSEWDREAVEVRQLGEPREVDGKWRVGYFVKVRITVRTPDRGEIVREGCGYGSGIDKDVGQSHESALKEAETDAMKRALMTFGNPFGLALYDKDKANVSDAPKAPAQESVMVKAARIAIDLCDTTAKLKQWKADNGAQLSKFDADEADEIVRHFNARHEELKLKAVA